MGDVRKYNSTHHLWQSQSPWFVARDRAVVEYCWRGILSSQRRGSLSDIERAPVMEQDLFRKGIIPAFGDIGPSIYGHSFNKP
ncbi:MAG: hypothetical protein ACYS80_26520 [Planctomycetota bacterium]